MRSRLIQLPLAMVLARKVNCLVSMVLVVSFAMFFSRVETAHALFPSQDDTSNRYKNVGIFLITIGPNDLGLTVGDVRSYGSGVLSMSGSS